MRKETFENPSDAVSCKGRSLSGSHPTKYESDVRKETYTDSLNAVSRRAGLFPQISPQSMALLCRKRPSNPHRMLYIARAGSFPQDTPQSMNLICLKKPTQMRQSDPPHKLWIWSAYRRGKISRNLSPSGKTRQVQNTTSYHNSGTINLNSIRISTVRGHAPYKYPPRNTMPKSPGTNQNPLRISWSDTSFSPTGNLHKVSKSDPQATPQSNHQICGKRPTHTHWMPYLAGQVSFRKSPHSVYGVATLSRLLKI